MSKPHQTATQHSKVYRSVLTIAAYLAPTDRAALALSSRTGLHILALTALALRGTILWDLLSRLE